MEDNGLQGLIGADNTTDAGYKIRMKAWCRLLVENMQHLILKAQITRLIDLERRDSCEGTTAVPLDVSGLCRKGGLKAAKPDRMPQKTSHADVSAKAQVGALNAVSSSAVYLRQCATSVSASASGGVPGVQGCTLAQRLSNGNRRPEGGRPGEAEKEQRTQAFRFKAARTSTTRNIVRINGLLEVPYIADTGADQSVVSSAIVDSLRAVQPDLRTNSLFSLISVTLADGRPEFGAGPRASDLNLRSVPCLILEGDGDEFLLGKDALKRLGIDVDQALARLTDSTLLADQDDKFPVGVELPGHESTSITTLDQLLERAVANRLPQEHVIAVRELLELFPDIWRAVVGAGRAASVEPLRATLRVDAKPYRSPPRKHPPLQADFIREFVKSLVADGLVEKKNAARWACAVVPVRKPGSRDKFCLAIDYRPVNRQTIPIAGVMPSAAVVMEVLLGQKAFPPFHITQGFWQLPLHPDSQELFSLHAEAGHQGAMDSALHFQVQMQTFLAPLIPHSALVWVDDVILFAPTMGEFLEVLKMLFTIVAEAKLGAEHGEEFSLRTGDSVVRARFIVATNWLHNSLPDYTRVIAHLHDNLESNKKRIGRRNRNALQVAITWMQEECSCNKRMLSLVKDSALIVHPDPDAEFCVFTDVSRFGFSIVETKVVMWQQGVPVDKQNHQLVICKEGIFKNLQLNWTVVKKETFPIVKACNDLENLLLRPRGFRWFCDHAKLIYIFAPHDELKKHVRDRLQRWAMRVCGLHYHIEHIAGDANVWSDIVSRWHILSRSLLFELGRHVVPVEELSALRPMMDAKFVFPTLEDIAEAQSTAGRERARLQVDLLEEDGVLVADGRPWDLLARILVVAHCGSQGHRGQEAMSFALKDRFFIAKLEDKIRSPLNTTEEIMKLVSSQGMLLGVDKFIEHRYNQELGRWELLVSWLGLQAIENSWEPLSTLLQDVPVKVREYVNASGSDEPCAQID
ncbi:LOW QUALITY PROTEIN: Hypothetical protein PHPALM_8773 [Phytophthora palmivora]|uniref:RNA-directed DNA polymerase n=1 Tax=Phytophthora palmivora TaxID=4796 RepID=A0A2P4Y9F9_9STRA|nr:LOW QUALITY PROTEIN: Hypothetical protein PHPALM_8773 [Phytophthora palmivora]